MKAGHPGAKRPNIIFIVADDLGYADLGCYGGRDNAHGPVSPALDALAHAGLRFTDGYANSPVCSPTRFAMITGRYQYRFRGGAEEPMARSCIGSKVLGLSPDLPTLPSLLLDAGYRTALVGKWHLGHPPHFSPLRSGYEEFFGNIGGGLDYFTHLTSGGHHDLWHGDEAFHSDEYMTDLLSQRAREYVLREDDRPFFLSLHYTAPHWPWETRDDRELARKVKNPMHLDGGSVEIYRRMIQHMDEGIGQLVDALRERGLLDNTLIVFTSDNGGERFSDNWPLVGGKMDLTEGGIRVPYIAHWPAAIPAGAVSAQHCLSMDWTATMLDAAGVAADAGHPLDGVSLMPVLREPHHTFARPMHWRMGHRGQRALREGDWKYLRVDGHDYLFDLTRDARERANQAANEPQRLADMRQRWEAWEASMPPVPEDATVTLAYTAKDMPQR